MKLATYNNRLTLLKIVDDKIYGIDIDYVSHGKYGPNIISALEKWDEFLEWAKTVPPHLIEDIIEKDKLDAPIPNPRQVFAIGMNYKSHAMEVGLELPNYPSVFTKFPSSVCGPNVKVKLPSNTVDWEVELVAVIGKRGRNISRANAWDHVAGFTIGQDISERTLQFEGKPPQFSMGKSYENFAPTGPWLTTLDEVINKEDLALECIKNEEVVQSSRTSNMMYNIPTLIEKLSQVVELLPGDLIFTGTPEGVGLGKENPNYLKSGDILVSSIEGLGKIRQEFI